MRHRIPIRPWHVAALSLGASVLAGMLLMAYNVWKTIAGQRAVDDAKIPAVSLAHA